MKLVQESPLLQAVFIVSPAIGYVPQLVTGDILFPPLVSAFFIMSSILKLFHYSAENYPLTLFLQYVFVIVLHVYLIVMNGRPLSSYESRMFKNRTTGFLYRRYGMKGCMLGAICVFVLVIHMLGTMYGSYGLCGGMSSMLEVSINLFQLMVEREERTSHEYKDRSKRSPKELYLCWVVGDVIKIWFMLKMETPMIFVGTVVTQILIDVLLILL